LLQSLRTVFLIIKHVLLLYISLPIIGYNPKQDCQDLDVILP
jgi:hypothetical protein